MPPVLGVLASWSITVPDLCVRAHGLLDQLDGERDDSSVVQGNRRPVRRWPASAHPRVEDLFALHLSNALSGQANIHSAIAMKVRDLSAAYEVGIGVAESRTSADEVGDLGEPPFQLLARGHPGANPEAGILTCAPLLWSGYGPARIAHAFPPGSRGSLGAVLGDVAPGPWEGARSDTASTTPLSSPEGTAVGDRTSALRSLLRVGTMAGAAMPSDPIRTSLQAVRRLAVTKQHLAGKRPARADAERIVATVRDLPYVQWDPVSVVAPSHLLSLWARVGSFHLADLDRVLWTERRLLQHWIPFAAVVATEDYPLYASLMRRYPGSLSDSWGSQRASARAFLAPHADLRRRVLRELRGGPLHLHQFKDHAGTKRAAGDWEPSSAVSEMLWHLLLWGQAMVVGHEGNQNLWGLPEAFLPSWVSRE